MSRIRRLCACAAIAALGSLVVAPESGAATPNLFGVNAAIQPTAAEFQRMGRGGVRTCRVTFPWSAVEPTPGARQWEELDAMVGDAAKAGVDIFPILIGTPQWLSSNPNRPPVYTPQHLPAWSRFVSDVVSRYGTQGSFWALHPEIPRRPIRAVQVWNEVNLSFFWGGRPQAGRYAQLLQVTAAAARGADPGISVVLSGLLPLGGHGTIAADRYLRSLYRFRGVKRLYDIVAVHPYARRPSQIAGDIEDLRTRMRKAKDRKPIWVTEFGWPTGGLGWSSNPFRATAGQQAARLVKTYKLLRKRAKRLGLERAFYFSFRDSDDPGVEDFWIHRMGLFDLLGTPKPAWFAYARAAGGTP